MSSTNPSLFDKLPAPIRNDPKKSAVLAVLTVLMAVLGVRQFAGSGSPAKASGAQPGTNLALDKSTPDTSAITGEASNASSEASLRVSQWLGLPIKALDRNLFETKLENFQRLDSTTTANVAEVPMKLFWEQLAKSLASQADQKKQKQIRSENLQLAAGALRLQTTIMGPSPRALIDGRMVRTGDMVEAKSPSMTVSFRVVQIEARRIVVEREGVQIELKMGAGKARILQEVEPAAK